MDWLDDDDWFEQIAEPTFMDYIVKVTSDTIEIQDMIRESPPEYVPADFDPAPLARLADDLLVIESRIRELKR